MALLYGNGDFTKTIAIATSMGYDCKQAATVGGLLGIVIGGSNIPDRFTKELPSRNKWSEPVMVSGGGSVADLDSSGGGDAECPFVVNVCDKYILFRNIAYWHIRKFHFIF